MSLSQLAIFPLDYALHFSAFLLHVLYFLYSLLHIVCKKQWRPKKLCTPTSTPTYICVHVFVYKHTSFYYTLLCCTLQILCFFFYKLKVCGNPTLTKSNCAVFQQSFLLLFVSHFGNSQHFKFFHYYYIYDENLWSVILMLLLHHTEDSNDSIFF